jgi:mycothione reductase
MGYTEQELKREGRNKNIEYSKSVYSYIDTAMGQALQDNDGFVRFLINKNDRKILGCHIIGNQASILIHVVLVAMKCTHNNSIGTIDNIRRTVHIHPAISEVVAKAAYQT